MKKCNKNPCQAFSKIFYGLLISALVLLSWPVGYHVLQNTQSVDSNKVKDINVTTKRYEGVSAYVINLDRSPERYNYVKPYLEALGLKFDRFSAVEGKALSKKELDNVLDYGQYRIFLGHEPKLGTIGCSLSHFKVWQKFLESDKEFALIFEDDISFDPEKLKIIISDLMKNHHLWDIVNLESSHNGFPLTIKTLSNNQHLVLYLFRVAHAGAYMINRTAAESLVSKALPIKMPIDHYFARSWEMGIKFTGVENPRPVTQSMGSSDIAPTKKIENTRSGLTIQERILRVMYISQSELSRLFYNVKLYFKIKE